MTKIPIEVNKRQVGFVEEGVYNTRRRAAGRYGPGHFFVKFQGYGISLHALKVAKSAGAETVRIVETTDTGQRNLVASVQDWFSKSKGYTYFGDEQLILPIHHMTVEKDG